MLRSGFFRDTPARSQEPSPYVLVRFEAPKTGAGTIGDLPVFVSPDYLLHELRLLEGVKLYMSADEVAAWSATVITD